MSALQHGAWFTSMARLWIPWSLPCEQKIPNDPAFDETEFLSHAFQGMLGLVLQKKLVHFKKYKK